MSENIEDLFDGFMPMIDQISVTEASTMLNTNGELIKAHSVRIKTRDASDHIFSIETDDLMRLFFVIMKAISYK